MNTVIQATPRFFLHIIVICNLFLHKKSFLLIVLFNSESFIFDPIAMAGHLVGLTQSLGNVKLIKFNTNSHLA